MATAADRVERGELIARRLQALDAKGLGDFGVEDEIFNWVWLGRVNRNQQNGHIGPFGQFIVALDEEHA